MWRIKAGPFQVNEIRTDFWLAPTFNVARVMKPFVFRSQKSQQTGLAYKFQDQIRRRDTRSVWKIAEKRAACDIAAQ
jgi:hypothetical protein